MEIEKLMEEDSAQQSVKLPSNDGLLSVSDLANEQLGLEKLVEEQEQALKELKDRLTEVREFKLPSALEALGLTSVTLSDDSVVSIKEDVYASISEANREAAFEWLENTDNDGIIKNEIKCPFGKGQDDDARKLVDLLSTNGYSFTNSRTVHPQTLKAFVRTQMEQALPIPTDVFSIHIKKIASIKLPRKR